MNRLRLILFSIFLQLCCTGFGQRQLSQIDLFGDTVQVEDFQKQAVYNIPLSDSGIRVYINNIDTTSLQPFLKILLKYRESNITDDWLYYQAVRKVAQYLSPKSEDYYRYTFYKWWLLVHSGYDAQLTFEGSQLLFYVQSNENIYNIPARIQNGKQYVCLNYHDYGLIDFQKKTFREVRLEGFGNTRPFSYKVTHLPDFNPADYSEKELQFNYSDHLYSFKIKLSPQVKNLFANYPVVDYELQCNMPMSQSTYQSLIPSLKQVVNKLSEKDGVDFLLHFTRYAFLFKPDREIFDGEKRMSPEQTLLYEYSDCEDRAALFFYLVKEMFNLPMIVVAYPNHVSVAVNFKRPYGRTISHNGLNYSICEPSPQKMDLKIGQSLPELKRETFEIAYAYVPLRK